MGGNPQESDSLIQPAKTAGPGSEEPSRNRTRPGRKSSGDRVGLIAGGIVLAACAGLALYGVLNTRSGGSPDASNKPPPTTPVVYEVTGTGPAELTYQARSTSGEAAVVHAAHLPWRKTVAVPRGEQPTLAIVLGENGGQAHCSVTIRGRHVQSATASGKFGRATCAGRLRSSEESENQP